MPANNQQFQQLQRAGYILGYSLSGWTKSMTNEQSKQLNFIFFTKPICCSLEPMKHFNTIVQRCSCESIKLYGFCVLKRGVELQTGWVRTCSTLITVVWEELILSRISCASNLMDFLTLFFWFSRMIEKSTKWFDTWTVICDLFIKLKIHKLIDVGMATKIGKTIPKLV
jgi:hypothetical protein